jgi:hypothetical protein
MCSFSIGFKIYTRMAHDFMLMVCLDKGFGAIIWGGAGIWGEDFSII